MTMRPPENAQVVETPQITARRAGTATPFPTNGPTTVVLDSRTSEDLSSRNDLLLQETIHRCANDLQLVVSLLALQSGFAKSPEARQALTDARDRVGVLARARTSLRQHPQTLEAALHNVCEALNSQAEPRSIIISLELLGTVPSLPESLITTLALVVNELATNSIKHAFAPQAGGSITVSVQQQRDRNLVINVEDNGSRCLPVDGLGTGGFGFNLVQRMLASISGHMIIPSGRSKCFEIKVPIPQ
jgi:two-component sensor histidine kinase